MCVHDHACGSNEGGQPELNLKFELYLRNVDVFHAYNVCPQRNLAHSKDKALR